MLFRKILKPSDLRVRNTFVTSQVPRIHDSVWIETPLAEKAVAREIMETVMTTAMSLSAPLSVVFEEWALQIGAKKDSALTMTCEKINSQQSNEWTLDHGSPYMRFKDGNMREPPLVTKSERFAMCRKNSFNNGHRSERRSIFA
jgi:hypothetical protein